jgi:hypothetical protein
MGRGEVALFLCVTSLRCFFALFILKEIRLHIEKHKKQDSALHSKEVYMQN